MASAHPAPGPVSPEPVSPDPPAAPMPPLLTQSWLDLAFLHWAVDPADVAPLLPPGTVPDTFDGTTTYVGLVAFRMYRVGVLGLPGFPYLGSFPETNVRLYSVDEHGRRAVVFRSLDASRLIPVLVARASFRLPYVWSRMGVERSGDLLTYTSRRRPGPRGARSRIVLRAGEAVEEPTPLEHFLTARWALHTSFLGRTLYLPNAHPRWPLHRAELVECDEDLVAAAGLPAPVGEPVSVLYSPGVRVRFGPQRRRRPGG
ncbi:YqjF family protein [Streptomyces sp. NPDC058576]|uniref:YqjF family protein n=1 Tax=Streptomyces sp. NPDC058576 TaxID=3346547 RepID=UPI00364D6B88